jgi:hypothetical protein
MRWLPHFKKTRTLWIAFDPDANGAAMKLGAEISKELSATVLVCSFPVKPDDFFQVGDAELFEQVLRQGRKV